MLPALHDEVRHTLLRVALLMCAASISLLPLTAQFSLDASAQAGVPSTPSLTLPSVPALPRFPKIDIERDPFVADAVDTVAMDDTVLPPNSDGPSPGAPAEMGHAGLVVRAIVLGSRARVLVDVGGVVRVLGIGD